MSNDLDPRIPQAVAGDSAALTELLREFGPRLREQLSIDRRWQSVLEPDDVLQVTYLEAFLQIRRFTPGGPGSFAAWLRRIAENNLRDAIKSLDAQKRPPPAAGLAVGPNDNSAIMLLDMLGVTSATPSRATAANEAVRAIDQALEALPTDYANVIRQYDLEGRSIEDVAAGLKRSQGAVYMLRARAHEQLRELLGPGSNFFSQSS